MANSTDFKVKKGLVVTTTATVQGTTNATGTTTGALIVSGGAGFGGDIYARNIYSNGQLIGQTSNTATNLAGGLQWQIPYQSATSSTTFISVPPTTATTVLQFVPGSGYSWTIPVSGSLVYAPVVSSFTGNGSTVNFTIASAPASKDYVTVVIDGVTQIQSSYTLSGNTVTLSEAPANGALIDIKYASLNPWTFTPIGAQGSLQYNNNGSLTGTTFMTYNSLTGVVSITSGVAATSTGTGSLVVTGGVGLSGDLYVGGKIVAQELDIQYTTVTTTLITTDDVIKTSNTTPTNNTTTGALIIGGGIGVGGSIYVGGVVTATSFVGNLIGNAASATTSTSAAFAYQTTGTLTAGTGINGTAFNGSANQTWTLNTATLMTTSVNLNGGTAGQFAYQTAPGTTAFISTGSMYVGRATQADSSVNAASLSNSLTFGTGLTGTSGSFNGSAAVTVSLNTATLMATAVNLAGGTAGQIAYQTGAGATSFISTSSIYVGRAVLADSATTSTNAGTSYATIGILTAGTGLTGSTFNGSSNVTWTLNTATLMTTSVNLNGGTAGQFAYQTAPGTTAFISTGSMYVGRASVSDTSTSAAFAYATTGTLTAGTGLTGSTFNGSSNITWTLNTATLVASAVTANNLAGGTAGYFAYQTAPGATSFASTTTMYVYRATQADSATGSAGSVVNSLTINNSNAGAASPALYNGSGAVTISANTVGALSLSGGGTVTGAVTFSGPVVFNSTATYALSTNTYYTDNMLELHVPPSGVGTPWFADDGKDIGFRFHYYTNSTDTNAALVLANDTKWLEWYNAGAEGTSTFAGSSYGDFKTGGVWATRNAGIGYTSSQSGAALSVNGGIYASSIVTATTFVGALTGTASSANALSVNVGSGYLGVWAAGSGTLSGSSANKYYVNNTTGILYGPAFTATSTASSVSTITGAVVVYGGMGVAGDIVVGGNVTATSFVGNLTGTASKATNIAGGVAGQLHYQSAVDVTSFISTATSGNFLQANYNGVPTWTSTGSMYVNRAVIADSAAGSSSQVNVIQQTNNANYFLTFVDTNNASPTAENVYTTSSLYINAATGVVTHQSSVAATSTNSGALQVIGGVGVGGNIYVGGNVVTTSALVQNPSATSVSTATTTIDTFDIALYRSAKYVISISNSGLGQYQTTEILLVHNNVTPYQQETSVFTGATSLMNFSTVISGGFVLLQATGVNTGNSVKVQKVYITV